MIRLLFLPLASLALTACAVPMFSEADSGTSDPPADQTTCEGQDKVFCSPGGCDKICHRKDVQRKETASHCDKPVVTNGMRIDNCADGNVCLEPAPNTSQGYFCFALCQDKASCPSGVACGDRALSGSTSIRVCDPQYKNCEEGCCDPTDITGKACDFNRPCYLVPALTANLQASWTVCEYASGGARKGEGCTFSRDCYEGLTCIGVQSGVKGSGTCVVVCDPSKENACAGNGQCQPSPKQWGYCP